MGNAILVERGQERGLGKRWIDRFIKRNPQVKTKPSDPLERARVRGSTREAFEQFFDLLERLVAKKQIKLQNIANIDEYGLQEGESHAGKVIRSSIISRTYVITSDTITWVSIIECGTVEGLRLTPYIIFIGASLQG